MLDTAFLRMVNFRTVNAEFDILLNFIIVIIEEKTYLCHFCSHQSKQVIYTDVVIKVVTVFCDFFIFGNPFKF